MKECHSTDLLKRDEKGIEKANPEDEERKGKGEGRSNRERSGRGEREGKGRKRGGEKWGMKRVINKERKKFPLG